MILSEHYYHYVDLYISCETIEKELNPHMIEQRLHNHFEISECFAFEICFVFSFVCKFGQLEINNSCGIYQLPHDVNEA